MKTQNVYRSLPLLLTIIFLIMVLLFVPLASRAQDTCVVNSTADSGPGTLRQCLMDVATGDIITFDADAFPPGNPAAISLESPLPTIHQGDILIDASDAGVILDGSAIPDQTGLHVQSDHNQIVGLQWRNFSADVIFVQGSYNLLGGDRDIGDGPLGQGNLFGNNHGTAIVLNGTETMSNTIAGNYIGVDLDGVTAAPNASGIHLELGASYNLVGGDMPGESNIISGNTWRGISINGVGVFATTDPLIDDVSLTFDGGANLLANSSFDTDTLHWVVMDDDSVFGRSLNTTIYHSAPASYQFDLNGGFGAMRTFYDALSQTGSLADPYHPDSTIWIPVTPDTEVTFSFWYSGTLGTAFILGLDSDGGWRNLEIHGGYSPVSEWTPDSLTTLVPSDIDAVGIQFDVYNLHQTAHNIISGNIIGADASGSQPLPNGEDGIHIEDGASQNQIGGGSEAERNIIFSNGGVGVRVTNPSTSGNLIQGNYIGFGTGDIRQAYPTDMAISPSYASDCTLYVATQSTGIHKTSDCGESWEEINNGLTESNIMLVDIPPDAPNADTVFALAQNGYLFITSDGGANWSLISTALEQMDRRDLAISADFSVDQTLYAAAENWSWDTFGNEPGVFKSTDGGISWVRADNGIGDKRVWKVEATSANTVFAMTYDTLYKSTDGGESWVALPIPGGNLTGLAISPNFASDNLLFAAAWSDSYGRIYRSTDGGTTWDGFDTPRNDPRHIAISPAYASDQTVCHGGGWNDFSYCSYDGGASWSQQYTGLAAGLANAVNGVLFTPNYVSNQTIYMISPSGIATSTDSGQTWQVMNALRPAGSRYGVIIEDGAHNNTIGPDNVISNNVQGIEINWGGPDNNIVGNRIGTWPDGLSALPNTHDGLSVNGSHNIITGNLVSGNLIEGIRIAGEETYENVVTGNLLGTDITGNTALGNGGAGLSLHSGAHHNIIGGDTPAERNIISGNGYNIGLWDWNTAYNTISGNYIGTNAAGSAGLYNGSGINIDRGAHHNLIGGDTPAEGNLISGNGWHGIQLRDVGTDYNVISANIIGLDATGAYAIPNGGSGVWVEGGPQNTRIGGDTPGERNIISGNGLGEGWDRVGVYIGEPDTAFTLVQGNYIGLDITGASPIGNLGHGVELWTGTHDNQILDNVISANGWEGILVLNETPNNLIDGNYIGLNAAGTAALGNRRNGIYFGWGTWDFRSPRDNIIRDNVISGNGFSDEGYSGIVIDGETATGNVIFGNYLGTDPSGTQPLPNGISMAGSQQPTARDETDRSLPNPTNLVPSALPDSTFNQEVQTRVLAGAQDESLMLSPSGAPGANAQNGITFYSGAHGNTVGPDNIIAYNGWHGIEVHGGSFGNTITQNSIFRNTQRGIALTDGGNHDLSAPRIVSSNLANGTASGTACANCLVEIFSTSDEEGQTYEGSAAANASGNWSFNAGHALAGPHLTATATNADGDTSPFSQRFNLLVYDLNVWQTFEALNRLGIQYDVVDAGDFATVNLSAYDVLFVGFTGNDPQPDDLLQPLLDRQADIAAFVQAGGALVANSEDGVVATPLDWQWVPVPVTHRNSFNHQMLINLPDHLLVEGLTESDLYGWWPYHNTFTAWTWPEAEVVLTEPGSGEAIILAGDYGTGRMIFSGSDPDYHDGEGPEKLLWNEIAWAAGVLADLPPFVDWQRPASGEATSAKTRVEAFFDQMIDPTTLTSANFLVVGSQSGAVAGTLEYDAYFSVASFMPVDPFLVGETITVTIRGDVLDMTGNGLDGNGDQSSQGSPTDDYRWTFTIRDPQTLIVNDLGDDGMWNYIEGQLTLRQAIEIAQAGDTITFDTAIFPLAAPATIFIENGELPWLSLGYLTLDASNAGVILDGSRSWGNAFNINSDGNVIRGLQILNFNDVAINLEWRSRYNVIGGSNPDPDNGCHGQCNLISGNGGHAIRLSGSGVMNNIISGNYIGTDIRGNSALGNNRRWGSDAIVINGAANHNQIGGDAPGERNLVNGSAYGVVIDGGSHNAIVGNYIGVNAAGNAAIGNWEAGGGVGSGQYNLFQNNLIGGNGWVGLFLHWWGTDFNLITGNRIGTDASGQNPIPNGTGIEIGYGASNNRIGGSTPTERNIIAFNHNDGISVQGSGSWGNTFQQNSIYAHNGQGIALWWFDALPQPVVLTANTAAGTASGTACANCTVEIFSDDDDEGRWYEGTTTADGSGNWSFNKGSAFSGPNVHTTATDADGNTSEFSGPGPVIDGLWPTGGNRDTNNLAVWIWGSNYRENPPLEVSFGDGIDVVGLEFHRPDLLKAYINIAPDAAFGLRDVSVTINDGQSFTLADAFEVISELPPPPAVTGVDPHQAAPNTESEFYLYGSNFIDLPQVSVSGGDVWVNWVEFHSDTRLRVSLTVADGAPLGSRDVTVINPEGQSFTLTDALLIAPPIFEDVAPTFGLNLDIGEAGAAWGDWNDDGWLDLAIGTGRLFTNNAAASFTDDSAAAGLEPVSPYDGVAWGDYNNDGKLDLLTSRGKIYRQNSLPFSKVFDSDRGYPALSWADYDLDGDLDAYASSRLYRNDGGDIFTDVTAAVGLTDYWIMSSSWADYDQDGYPDLYLAASGYAYLYHNDGGTFTDVTEAAGMNLYSSGHGSAWGDFDNDGDLDLFVASNDNQFSLLFRNHGDGTFSEVGEAAGLRDRPGNATGANWLDYDLDGWLDIFVVNRDDKNRLYHNNADGTFTDYASAMGVAYNQDSDGSSVGDYDNDGDPDIYVVSGIWDWRQTPSLLLQNNLDHADRHWLKVRLEGILSNHTGIGARIVIYTDGPLQTREIAGSSSYMSQDAPEALFGLGSYTGTVGVIVYWPSGVVDVKNATVDQTIVIAESTPYFHDLGLTSVLPAGEQPIEIPIAPFVTLRNYGQSAESGAPVTCRIVYNGAEIYAQTLNTGAIPAANWESIPFPAFTPTQTGGYTLTCQVALPGDERSSNDLISQAINVTEQVADVWSKDDPRDDGDVPSSLNNWYMSPDLWVRNAPDGGLIPQDPIQGITNTVYVRLRNRGNIAISSGDVSVYWIEPSLGVRCGGWAPIGVIPFTDLQPGEERILSIPWVPTRSGHTCLQDVINSSQDPFAAALECTPQWVPWDNNVSWHNVNILANSVSVSNLADGASVMDIKESAVQLVNIYEVPKDVDVIVDRLTFPAEGDIVVRLPQGLFQRWINYANRWGEGIEVLAATQEIRITGAVSATIGAIPMMANEEVTVNLQFTGPAGLEFEMGIRERIDGITLGGVAYQWIIPDTTPPTITSVAPVNEAANVLLDVPIVITFSEPVSPMTFELLASPDPGSWTFAWNNDYTTVTAQHASFSPGIRYRFSFTISDASGNPLVAPYEWEFTTLTDQYYLYLPVVIRQ